MEKINNLLSKRSLKKLKLAIVANNTKVVENLIKDHKDHIDLLFEGSVKQAIKYKFNTSNLAVIKILLKHKHRISVENKKKSVDMAMKSSHYRLLDILLKSNFPIEPITTFKVSYFKDLNIIYTLYKNRKLSRGTLKIMLNNITPKKIITILENYPDEASLEFILEYANIDFSKFTTQDIDKMTMFASFLALFRYHSHKLKPEVEQLFIKEYRKEWGEFTDKRKIFSLNKKVEFAKLMGTIIFGPSVAPAA